MKELKEVVDLTASDDYKERLITEQKELKERLVKLVNFMNSGDFYKLSENNRKVLNNQKIAMEFYLNILTMRVYQDIDNIVVPDMAMLSLMIGMFNYPHSSFQKTESMKAIEEEIKNHTQKDADKD